MAGSDAEALPSEIVSTSRTRPEAGAAEAARVPRPGSLAARRAAQAEYYGILADTAVAVDEALGRPGPHALRYASKLAREEAALRRVARDAAV